MCTWGEKVREPIIVYGRLGEEEKGGRSPVDSLVDPFDEALVFKPIVKLGDIPVIPCLFVLTFGWPHSRQERDPSDRRVNEYARLGYRVPLASGSLDDLTGSDIPSVVVSQCQMGSVSGTGVRIIPPP
jgi:hypothetical protein